MSEREQVSSQSTPETTIKQVLQLKIKSKTKELEDARKDYNKYQAGFNKKANELANTFTAKQDKTLKLLKELQAIQKELKSLKEDHSS